MTVLEMIENDVNSVVGLNVSYEFGGSKPITGKVMSTKKNTVEAMIDGELSTWYSYGISFNAGGSFYTVDKFTRLLGE